MAIFAIIAAMMIFFGLPTQSNLGGSSAAQVNSKLIPLIDLEREENRMSQMYGQFFGGSGRQSQMMIRRQALERLIEKELVTQGIKEAGLVASKEEVAYVILETYEPFKEDGVFSRSKYQNLLTANRMSPQEFEEIIANDRLAFKATDLFQLASKATKQELEKSKALKTRKRNVEFIKFKKDQLAQSITVDNSAISNGDEAFEKEIKDYYEKNKSKYLVQEEVKAQHILIKSEGKKDEEVLKQIQDIKAQVTDTNFGELAEKHSEDPGSKKKKGDLGYFGKGRMVPAFEKVAFELKPGTVSDPVKTNFGYHIIKVNDHKKEYQKPLEEVRDEIAKRVLQDRQVDSKVEELEKVIASGEGLDEKLKSLKLNWQTTGDFALDATSLPRLGGSEAVRNAAFAVTQEKPLHDRLVREGSDYYLIRYKGESVDDKSFDKEAQLRNISYEKVGYLRGGWIDSLKEGASITRNELMFQ